MLRNLLMILLLALMVGIGPPAQAQPYVERPGAGMLATTPTTCATASGNTYTCYMLAGAGGGGGGAGDASAANQTAVQALPGSDATKAQAVQGVTGGKAVAVSAASLPLPTGAATAANQTTQAASLATIAAAAGQPIVITETPTTVSLTTGGTGQDALAANASRVMWCIQSSNTNTGVSMVAGNATATAGIGTEVMPGQQICNLSPAVSHARISVWNGTTGATFRVVSGQ